ncbi:DUF2268 domain-containing putative Zn-dependent protease [Flavobacterium sp.]|uniref:DUF2268 domain-containing putative Zn-dependent protease n=1 Tax=Flavobacterium sp. TaxID=239 RepID=UPI00260D9E31|nr:DUF2268 domain-containing putative Zn-dependent protease [Flavobacterium sp.]
MKKIIVSVLMALALTSCLPKKDSVSMNKEAEVYRRLEKIPDSVRVGEITILNLFKNQILAHKAVIYDSLRIVENVYKPHKGLWDDCYGAIFGEENASKFNTPEGMIKWNKTFYKENKIFIDQRVLEMLQIDMEQVFKERLLKFEQMVPYVPKARISILFTPITGIGFGGCNAEQFAFELNNNTLDVQYSLEKGLPHELNHLVYEKFRGDDVDSNSALSQTIDEGFACYFTYVFFNKKITEHEAVENMSKADWDWFLKHEKEIFTKVKPYFSDKSGDNPLLRNDKLKLFPEAPKTLNYWLGFRIISKYVEKHGKNSWRDIYTLKATEVLEKSGYENYIQKL